MGDTSPTPFREWLTKREAEFESAYGLGWPWYLRYPFGVAVTLFYWWILADEINGEGWRSTALFCLAIAISIYGALMARELVGVGLIIAFGYWLVTSISENTSSLTPAQGILIGAVIIAWAIYASRKSAR